MQRTRNCELWKGAKPVSRDEPTLNAWGKVVSVEKKFLKRGENSVRSSLESMISSNFYYEYSPEYIVIFQDR